MCVLESPVEESVDKVVILTNGKQSGKVICSHNCTQHEGFVGCVDWLMDCKRCEGCPMEKFTLRCDCSDEYRTMYPHSPFETEEGEDFKDFVNSLKQ